MATEEGIQPEKTEVDPDEIFTRKQWQIIVATGVGAIIALTLGRRWY